MDILIIFYSESNWPTYIWLLAEVPRLEKQMALLIHRCACRLHSSIIGLHWKNGHRSAHGERNADATNDTAAMSYKAPMAKLRGTHRTHQKSTVAKLPYIHVQVNHKHPCANAAPSHNQNNHALNTLYQTKPPKKHIHGTWCGTAIHLWPLLFTTTFVHQHKPCSLVFSSHDLITGC